jgi:hypothetical protein
MIIRKNMIRNGFVFVILFLFLVSNIGSALNGPSSVLIIPMNQPPYIPSDPSPPNKTAGVFVRVDLFWTGGDPDGDPVTYTVYFGTTSPPKKIVNNQSALSYTPSTTLSFNTTYYWKIVAWDKYNLSAEGPLWCFTTMESANYPPYQPSRPVGIIHVNINLEYTYISGTYDPNNDKVYYLWDWGDGNTSGWLGPYDSGVLCGGTHIWKVKDACNIKVKAKDSYGKESEWSDPLPITVPYSYKNPFSAFVELVFKRFFNIFPML